MTMFEIVNKQPIVGDEIKSLPYLHRLKGSPAVVPNTLLRENMTFEIADFGRSDELWEQMLKCWNMDPNARPQSWQVGRTLNDLYLHPQKPEDYGYVNALGNVVDTSQKLGGAITEKDREKTLRRGKAKLDSVLGSDPELLSARGGGTRRSADFIGASPSLPRGPTRHLWGVDSK